MLESNTIDVYNEFMCFVYYAWGLREFRHIQKDIIPFTVAMAPNKKTRILYPTPTLRTDITVEKIVDNAMMRVMPKE